MIIGLFMKRNHLQELSFYKNFQHGAMTDSPAYRNVYLSDTLMTKERNPPFSFNSP